MTTSSETRVVAEDGRIEIFLMVPPVPASRAKVTRRGSYYPKRYKEWRKQVAKKLPKCPIPWDGALSVAVSHVCTRPKKPANPYPVGDIDNYNKAILDALTDANYWFDDKQVVQIHATKEYAAIAGHGWAHVTIVPATF